jgi:hypothetical protein
MFPKSTSIGIAVLTATAAGLAFVGCSQSAPNAPAPQAATSNSAPPAARTGESPSAAEPGAEHGHIPGAHGGIIVSLGRDSYHVEAIVTNEGELRLYTLGNDETRVMDIAAQPLVAYGKPTGGTDSVTFDIAPSPQPGDAKGQASMFVAKLPQSLVGGSIDVTVPSITIQGERFRLGFTTKSEEQGGEHRGDAMPAKIANDAERELYLTPGGHYTQADIVANGNVTASQKFAGFRAEHDLNPKVGDKICPVTLTKANPKCTWIVAGEAYEFCCPPCVDEFVLQAKTKTDDLKPPTHFVKREAGSTEGK